MNLKETGLFIIISLLAVTACILYTEYYSVPLSAGGDEGKTITTPYVYPVTPADREAWAKLTPQERHDVCQIPEEILENMTTDALIDTVLDYPNLPFFAIYSSQYLADRVFNVAVENFNGLAELLKRDGLDEALAEKYADIETIEALRASADYASADFNEGLKRINSKEIINQLNRVTEYLAQGGEWPPNNVIPEEYLIRAEDLKHARPVPDDLPPPTSR